jgi:hypothetical protein
MEVNTVTDRIRLSTIAMGALLAAIAASAGAVAPQRTFVSTGGNDANAASNCSLPAPCRSFGTAIGVVATGGEVVALDSGGYGRFTVAKSVAVIAAPGVHAAISVFVGTNGVDINTAGVKVVLRGLTIAGQGGDNGIYFQGGNSLVVESCEIASMSASGILISAPGSDNDHPSRTGIIGSTLTGNAVAITVTGGPASATVSNSSVVGNIAGIELLGTLAAVENALTIAATTIANSTFGEGVLISTSVAGATVAAVVSDSTISENASNGIYLSGAAGSMLLTATNNAITRNFNGISHSGSGTIKSVLAHNTISRNHSAGVFVGGTVLSRGDNVINDNLSIDITGPLGSIGGV